MFYLTLLHLGGTLHQFCTCLSRKTFLIGTVDGITHIEIILGSQKHLVRHKREERYLLICHRELGHHLYPITLILGELILHLEGADGIYLIAKEIDAVRELTTIGIDIEDGTTQGKLTWLVDIIHLAEAKLMERLLYLAHSNDLTFLKHQLAGIKALLRDHHLGESLRVSHDIARCPTRETGQNFCAENLRSGITLGILDGPAITGGEEKHIIITQ